MRFSIPQWCDCDSDEVGTYSVPTLDFQSHNGAIATSERSPNANLAICAFSIPQWCDCDSPHEQAPLGCSMIFNPTMVRLRLPDKIDSLLVNYFQSHNGAIATIEYHDDHRHTPPLFNPTMVRLLQGKATVLTCEVSDFQSHNGAIATQSLSAHRPVLLCVFNPTMVRLRRGKNNTCEVSRHFQSHNGAIATFWAVLLLFLTSRFSIPQWCDCDQSKGERSWGV